MSVKGEGLPGTPNQGVRKVEGQSALATGATGGIGALPPPPPSAPRLLDATVCRPSSYTGHLVLNQPPTHKAAVDTCFPGPRGSPNSSETQRAYACGHA